MPELNERDQGLQNLIMTYLNSYTSQPQQDYEDALGVIFVTAAGVALTQLQTAYDLSRTDARRLIDVVYATQKPFLDAFDMDRKPDSN